MNIDRIRTWMVAAVVTAALAGCGHWPRTAHRDPFLDDSRLADAPRPPANGASNAGAPAVGTPPGRPAAMAAANPRPQFQTAQKPAARTGYRDQKDIVDPFLAQKPASSANPAGSKSQASGSSPKTEQRTAAKPRASLAPEPSAPGSDSEDPFLAESTPAKPSAAAPAAESDNPFETADEPVKNEKTAPLARASQAPSSAPRGKAAPFPDADGHEESLLGVSESKLKAKPAPRTTAAAATDDEESPFAALKRPSKPAPRATQVAAEDEAPFADTAAPAKRAIEAKAKAKENPLALRKPFPPRVQSPEDEEFEENPFARHAPQATAKSPVTVAAEAPETEEEPDDEPARIRVSIPAVQQTGYQSETPLAEKPTAYRRRYRPMPAENEAGWKRRTAEEEEESIER